MWILLSFIFVTYLPNDSGAFCFVMMVVYLFLWWKQLWLAKCTSSSRPPPAPDPAHVKKHKELIKEIKWRADIMVLPPSMYLLWLWLSPISAPAPFQGLYVSAYLLASLCWFRRRWFELSQGLDWTSNRLGRAETVITLSHADEQVVRIPSVHDKEILGHLLEHTLKGVGFRILGGILFYAGSALRIACRLCWMVAWSFVFGVTVDWDVQPVVAIAEGVASPEGVLGGLIVALDSPFSRMLVVYSLSRLLLCLVCVPVILLWAAFVKLPCLLLAAIKKTADDDPALLLLDVLHLLQGPSSDIEHSWQWLPSWRHLFDPWVTTGAFPTQVDTTCAPATAYTPDYPEAEISMGAIFNVGWRLRRRYRSIEKRQEKRLNSLTIESNVIHHALPDIPAPEVATSVTLCDSILTRFVSSFNPALAGIRMLGTERLDKHKLRKIRRRRKVSVDLRRCYSQIVHHMLGIAAFPAMTEVVLNSIGGPGNIPLIMDTGASCCVSPCKEDFIEYRDSQVKITDLSATNSVAGEGLIRWKVLDASGNVQIIDVKGYHVPRASVRLLSPQTIIQLDKSGDTKAEQGLHDFRITMKDRTVLLAPYGRANLPVLPMYVEGKSNIWTYTFSFNATDRDIWKRNVLDEMNQNLSLAQKELLLWHQRLSHAGLTSVHNLCRVRRQPKVDSASDLVPLLTTTSLPCTFNVPGAACGGLLCAACEVAKATRRNPGVRPANSSKSYGSLRKKDIKPGDFVSCDHYGSPIRGRVVSHSGHSSTRHGYEGGCIFVDGASGWIFHHAQKSLAASDTIRSKLLFEREAADVNVKIKEIHSDNGVFQSQEFRDHCANMNQKLTFSAVGAKHQNAIAENVIRTVCNMARACMIHATIRWPERSLLDMWPQAMSYAIWVHNRLPPHGNGLSPQEVWSGIKNTHSELPRAHVFGCPVYVLDPALQDNKKIPKWDSKARQGIFVGFSKEHSSLAPLVYNPRTQHISPQYHVIFDDKFSTVPSLYTEPERNLRWEELFKTIDRELYIDPEDVDAGKIRDTWLLPRENTTTVPMVDPADPGLRVQPDNTPDVPVGPTVQAREGDGLIQPEPAPPIPAPVPPIPAPPNPPSPPPALPPPPAPPADPPIDPPTPVPSRYPT
jgi:transposase InsO family protein